MPKQPAVPRRWPRILLAVLAAAGLFVLFSGEIRDSDFYWHLTAGRQIWKAHALPASDPFSFTTALSADAYRGEAVTRRVNLTHEWLSQVVMYATYSLAGIPGLVLARIILLELFCALVGYIVWLRTREFFLSVAGALAAAGMAFYFQQSRPFLITFLFTAATVATLESRRKLWLLPPIFLIWANCHGGFVVGLVVCAVYVIEALVARLRGKTSEKDGRLFWAAGLSAVASAINPNGFRVFEALFLYRSSGIQTDNLEWQRPVFWHADFYGVLLFGSLLALLFAYKRAALRDWLLYMSFAALSLMAVRNTIFLGLVGPLVIADCIRRWRLVSRAALPIAAIGLSLCGVRAAVGSNNVLAFRSADWQYPAGAASFIESHRIAGRMFNSYEAGGYLMWRLWPTQPTFIDGRGLSEQAYADYKKILYSDGSSSRRRNDLFNKYDIRMLVVPGFDYLSGQVLPIAAELATSEDSEWRLAYADAAGFVFIRNAPAELTNVPGQTALLQSLEAQCDQHLAHDPLHPRCAFGLGEFYAHLQNQEKARDWVNTYLAHKIGPDSQAEHVALSLRVTDLNQQAVASAAGGNTRAAELMLREAVATAEAGLGSDDPDTAGSLNNLASLLEDEGNTVEAAQLFRRALAICEKTLGRDDPRTASARDNLAELSAAERRGNRSPQHPE